MSKNILDNLFNSRVRVKVLRFLFRNYPSEISIKDLAVRVQESYQVTKKELNALKELGIVKRKRA